MRERKSVRMGGGGVWRCEDSEAGYLWYFELAERAAPPYRRQIHVEAIVDLDADGRVAGIEIIDGKMPAPPLAVEAEGHGVKQP